MHLLTLFLVPSLAFAQVEGVEIGQCDNVEPDPVTGQKLVYCCLDEIYLFQKEGKLEELDQFLSALEETRDMDADTAQIFYESRYSSSLHQEHGWTSFCGPQIPCHRCTYGTLCGNGVIQDGEECDNERQNSDTAPNACRSDCKLPRCGDYIRDTQYGEECDEGDGNADTIPDRCRTDCTLPTCGDGVIDTGEGCDDGNNLDGDDCTSTCSIPATVVSLKAAEICGDGVVDDGEECDDGNDIHDDGCTHRCTLPVCGDGIAQPSLGEECDLGSQNGDHPNAECRTSCLQRTCGDGIVDTRTEECDDGNDIAGDGCYVCSEEMIVEETVLPAAPEEVEDAEEVEDVEELEEDRRVSEIIAHLPVPTMTSPIPDAEVPAPLPVFHQLRQMRASQRQASITSTQTKPTSSPETGPASIIIVAAGAGLGWAASRAKTERRKDGKD